MANIGVLGTGDVGQVLGRGFVEVLGHSVKLGARDANNEKAQAWASKVGGKGSHGTFADAAKFGELIVLATSWSGTENALKMAGFDNFAGKVVIDATNPLKIEPGKMPGLALGHTDSGGEQIQRWLPKAKVVKCFNTVGNAHMVKPSFPGGAPDMFIAGNDDGAKKTVAEICKAFGWGVVDAGGIEGARLLEPMCILWVEHGIRSKSWNHAFKLLQK